MRAISRLSHASSYGVCNNVSFLGSLDLVGESLPKERFASGVTDEMICLICELVSVDPVYVLCCPRKYYCYRCIVGDRKDCPTIICPSCLIPVNSRTLTRNDSLRNTIFSLKTILCDYVNAGCSTLSTVDTINNHVDSCQFQPSPCINRGCTEICLLKDWEWHYKVKCPKRQTRCSGSCHSLIHADEIDLHDCDNVLKEFKSYQQEEIELMCRLFREETQIPHTLADRVDHWHAQKQNQQLAASLSTLKYKLMLLNEDDEVHDSLGNIVHHGKWRCSNLECKLPYKEHDFTKHFADRKRHIFFWDCCLNDNENTTTCDLFSDMN